MSSFKILSVKLKILYVHSLMCYEDLSETINHHYKPKISKESSRINNISVVVLFSARFVLLFLQLSCPSFFQSTKDGWRRDSNSRPLDPQALMVTVRPQGIPNCYFSLKLPISTTLFSSCSHRPNAYLSYVYTNLTICLSKSIFSWLSRLNAVRGFGTRFYRWRV